MTESNKPKEQDILMELEDVHMFFGKVCALAGVILKVRKGEIHSVVLAKVEPLRVSYVRIA